VIFDTAVFLSALPTLAVGLWTTVWLSIAAIVVGSAIGTIACIGRLLGRGALNALATAYVNLFRGLPETVLIFWIYACGPLIFDIRLSDISSAILALSLVAGAYLGEIFRAGVLAVPRGQRDAAEALGLTLLASVRFVIAPQAFRIMLPAFFSLVTIVIKNSSIVSAIGVAELFYRASILAGDNFKYFEVFSSVGALYFALIFPLSLASRKLELRLRLRLRLRLSQT
jgi:His/Glu/Gln/Arg/opine family amino acid ABC transporter permease subunit